MQKVQLGGSLPLGRPRMALLMTAAGLCFLPACRCCRSQFPASVWSKVASLFSEHRRQPLAVDVAVGCEGLAGPEVASR